MGCGKHKHNYNDLSAFKVHLWSVGGDLFGYIYDDLSSMTYLGKVFTV